MPGREHAEPILGPLVGFAGLVLAPAGVVTGVLYYFGYVRERALFGHFGVDLGSVGFSTTDYLVRSAGSVFLPLATVLGSCLCGLVSHHVLLVGLARLNPVRQRLPWLLLGIAGAALAIAGALGLFLRADATGDPIGSPVALGGGALLVEYALSGAISWSVLPVAVAEALGAAKIVRRTLLSALCLVAAFWATASVADRNGSSAARAIEASLPGRAQAVVYSADRLQVTGPGVGLVQLAGSGGPFAFRYNGLRTLLHSDGRWFLLPVGWTHGNGATVILLPDDVTGIRVDLAP